MLAWPSPKERVREEDTRIMTEIKAQRATKAKEKVVRSSQRRCEVAQKKIQMTELDALSWSNLVPCRTTTHPAPRRIR